MKKIVSISLLACIVSLSLNAGILEYGAKKATSGFKNKLSDAVKKEYVNHRKQQRELEGNNKSRLTKMEDKTISTKNSATQKSKEIVGQENINKYNKAVQYKDERVGQFKNSAMEDAKEVFGESKVNKAIELKRIKEQKETDLANRTIEKSKELFLKR